MTENQIAKIIVDVAYNIHVKLGPGLLESTYETLNKQLLTYLRVADKKLGLLINFGDKLIKDGIKGIANGLEDENDEVLADTTSRLKS